MKRRHIETSPPSISATLEKANNSSPLAREVMQSWDEARAAQPSQASIGGSALSSPTAPLPPPLAGRGHVKKVSIHGTKKLPSRSNTGNTSGYAEETNIYTETRMLQDQSRRLRKSLSAPTLMVHSIFFFADVCSYDSLHWRCLDTVHPAADPDYCRKHIGDRDGVSFYRRS